MLIYEDHDYFIAPYANGNYSGYVHGIDKKTVSQKTRLS